MSRLEFGTPEWAEGGGEGGRFEVARVCVHERGGLVCSL
jgi:hypothetical protein